VDATVRDPLGRGEHMTLVGVDASSLASDDFCSVAEYGVAVDRNLRWAQIHGWSIAKGGGP